MSIGPEPSFASTTDHAAVSRLSELLEYRRPTRADCKEAMMLVYSLAVDANDLAQAASDLLYLQENDSPDSPRIAAAERTLRQRMNLPARCIQAVERRMAERAERAALA